VFTARALGNAESLVIIVGGFVFNHTLLGTIHSRKYKGSRARYAAEVWLAIIQEGVLDMVVRTFMEIQVAARAPQNIIPELTIVFHAPNKFMGVRLWVFAKGIGLPTTMVNKTDHIQSQGDGAIGRFKKGSEGLVFKGVEEDRVQEAPDSRQVATALAGAVDWKGLSVRVPLGRNTQNSFQYIWCSLQGFSMDKSNFAVNPKASADNGRQYWKDMIITQRGINIEFNQAFATCWTNFHFQFFSQDMVVGLPARP
jgi:hypothetical protein